MGNRRFEMYEYKQIIYRLRQGQTIRAIHRDGLANREKIKDIKKVAELQGWLSPEVGLPEENTLHDFFNKNMNGLPRSKTAFYAEIVKNWVEQGIQATVIHQHLKDKYGFSGAYNSVQRYIQQIKAKSIQLTVPLHFQPGEAAQVDFGKGPSLFDERTGSIVDTWFFVMTLCWSRHQYAQFITHQDIETWLDCHQKAFNWFNGVVNKVIIDNPKCAITKACYYEPQVQRSYEALAEAYGFIVSACPPSYPMHTFIVPKANLHTEAQIFASLAA